MKKVLLIPFLAAFTLLIAGFACAVTDSDGIIVDSSLTTSFNDVVLGSSTVMAGDVGSVVPVRITFEADDNVSDVRVEVEMDGFRDDVSAKTGRFDIVAGSTYSKLLSLRLPSDADDLTDEYTLKVEISHKGSNVLEEYTVKMQRDSYTMEILSVDYNSEVSAGDVFPVSVVLKNVGFNRADDNYVIVSVPSLGISARGYVGDLVPTEECGDNCDDEEDSIQKTVYLKMPENTQAGIYELEVEAYNKDSNVVVTKLIGVDSSASKKVLAAVKNQDISAGETKTFDLIIVNSGNDVEVYSLEAVSGSALAVSVPSVVTVGPKSSERVPVVVTASNDAEVGTYTFSVNVDGEQVVFGVNVIEGSVSASVVALTVILVIVFVVLLAVLVILLTRKEKTIEEVETSYY